MKDKLTVSDLKEILECVPDYYQVTIIDEQTGEFIFDLRGRLRFEDVINIECVPVKKFKNAAKKNVQIVRG